ncbi:MAG: transcription elongation factor subunit Spt4 [Candidatus Altiarchaeota archaeon]
MRACKVCHRIIEEELCPECNAPTSQYWSGFLGIINPTKSEIAKRLGIKVPGQYALKVR